MPTVSVIIPTYNRREYIQEVIDGVLAQTYADYEIIVVDDGSTDWTSEALRERYRDRIRCVLGEPGRPGGADSSVGRRSDKIVLGLGKRKTWLVAHRA